ncbi:hypothetical protein Y1Q_0017240 [Alligator mississippiensis]|uniref:Uncharacterized protein n=1 Tax=Alligator mississippiensis TaxID=8496 RepID=A0A151NKV1_ALLMI|nr:hypothetical protein Y1Q_0017240 [Alligator mississippiensis]
MSKLEDSYIIAENLVISVRRSRIPIQRSSPARGVCPAVAAWPCSRGIFRSTQAQLYHLNRCYEEQLSEQDHSEAESAQLFHSKDHPNSPVSHLPDW